MKRSRSGEWVISHTEAAHVLYNPPTTHHPPGADTANASSGAFPLRT